MKEWKLTRNTQKEVDPLPEEDCKELADEELESVAGGSGNEYAIYRCRKCHHVFTTPNTGPYHKCPKCGELADKMN